MIQNWALMLLFTVGVNLYSIGIGIHDITGPIAGVNMMGYAMINQITGGLQSRLYSRAFIVSSGNKTVVLVSVDAAMMSGNVKKQALEFLSKDFGDLFNNDNVLITATHTHSSPAGFHDYLLYQVTSAGYIESSAMAMAIGISESVKRAYKSMKESFIFYGEDDLLNASANRSPLSYQMNPAAERALYKSDVDTLMSLITFRDKDNHLRGLLNFFAVHCVSLNNTNKLVSGDNKGYASYLMEKRFNNDQGVTPYSDDEKHKKAEEGNLFVAAFAQSNEGDVTPNTEGAFCIDTGKPCDNLHSTCPDKNGNPTMSLCNSRGPGWKVGDQESSRLIGLRQYLKAKDILSKSQGFEITGEVDFEHGWIDISNISITLNSGKTVTTCPAARGFSFAAGTTDGPGSFNFLQGDNSTGNPFWLFVRNFLSKPSKKQVECHYPKPILLNTGEMKLPYPWEPATVSIQIVKVGELYILGVPGEFTTMAGRRLRNAVKGILQEYGIWDNKKSRVIIAGLSNMYTAYVSTYEEYQMQRYEGASTTYGPYTLDGYIQEFKKLASNLASRHSQKQEVFYKFEKAPKDFIDKMVSLVPNTMADVTPLGKRFGQVVFGWEPKEKYQVDEEVEVKFYTGHLRNGASVLDKYLESSFFWIERFVGNLNEVKEYVKEELNKRTKDIEPGEIKVSILGSSATELIVCVTQGKEEEGCKTTITLPAKSSWWRVIRDDSDYDTTMTWEKNAPLISSPSYATIKWKIGNVKEREELREVLEGLYRIRFKGFHKTIFGSVSEHEGITPTFEVRLSEFVIQDNNMKRQDNWITDRMIIANETMSVLTSFVFV